MAPAAAIERDGEAATPATGVVIDPQTPLASQDLLDLRVDEERQLTDGDLLVVVLGFVPGHAQVGATSAKALDDQANVLRLIRVAHQGLPEFTLSCLGDLDQRCEGFLLSVLQCCHFGPLQRSHLERATGRSNDARSMYLRSRCRARA